MKSDTQLARLGLFDARVPRYTSYPTAPQFKPGLGSDKFADWVRAIAPGSQISLYLHVPFCRRLCWFCACRTQGTRSLAPVLAYVETLKAELDLLRAILPEGVTLSRLHWGGGTPTLLPPEQMRDLAAHVLTTVPLGENAEFSVEIDPNEIDDARLDALAEAGMNRASIGVQDFDPEIQAIIGRDQSFEITHAAAEAIRARGIRSLNADILYGLPDQTTVRMTDSVQKLLSLNPDRVALYGYAHVPWMARRQQLIPSDSLPRPEERLGLYETARRLFLWDGYDEIGIDHFARPHDGLAQAAQAGRLKRNFQGYTDDTAPVLIGLGASSISRFPQGYAQNAPGTSDWTKSVRKGQFATSRGHVFQGDDILRARIIEMLMCDFATDDAELITRYGATQAQLEAMYRPAVAHFDPFLKRGAGGLEIPLAGRPLTRMIAAAFDAYAMSREGHSSAV
ncbi:oxygen-independent coproporphyrinogen III oxidase [Rhodobacteraceae bacterium 2376]|uniref:Coproporphyrinogen-III oxidase n=1 Tax=Rhabdonatronobacter sediminivivens TaxID=2743469 RepID=A0A7Z0HY47_9RHOB|nr:oxygen-independent coproporphyrinogen III oxidase [Rhabdonatronobacter sediminivivens]NYS24451.1 oxygen-independent coproporphyrinogen III oxidase [Rhabdonatronobacter sediminivivens]